jgi:nicotinamide mononucleotide transporter
MNKFEKIWLYSFSIIILFTTIYFSITGTNWSKFDNVVINWFFSPISALTGVACIVLAARGSYWNVPVGVINSIFYGIVAYKTGYYGDFLLNIFYFLPTQYFIWKGWKYNTRDINTDLVKMKKLTLKQIIYLSVGGVVVTIIFGFILYGVDHFALNILKRNASIYNNITKIFNNPFIGPILDGSTEVTQIIAGILMILRYAEQWVLWFITDVITIIMWFAVVATDKTSYAYSIPTLVMWVAYLINAIYGWYNWYKGSK